MYQSQLFELSMIICEQDTTFSSEIKELQDKMNNDEEIYQQKISKLTTELQKIRERKKSNTNKRNQKIDNFRKQIENMENEISAKISKSFKNC